MVLLTVLVNNEIINLVPDFDLTRMGDQGLSLGLVFVLIGLYWGKFMWTCPQ